MITWNRRLIDAFFYQNFQEVWYGAQPSDMPPIYHSELFSLLSHAQNKSYYEQEQFHDYELALRLSVVENGRRKQVTHRKSPYSILFEEENVTFRIGTETVWTCTYSKFYKLFQFYVRLYCKQFDDPCKKDLLREVSKLQRQRLLRPVAQLRGRFKKFRHKRVKRLVSNQSYEYAKSLTLSSDELLSFSQLNCADTLVKLTVVGEGIKDVNLLAGYSHLQTLSLCEMGLTDLSFLSPLTSLTELILRNNNIRDLTPLAGLDKLNSLYLAGNPIRDFSVLANLPNLKSLYADEQQLPDEASRNQIPSTIALRVVSLTASGIPHQYDAVKLFERLPSSDASGRREDSASAAVTQAPDPRKLNIKDRWLFSGLTNALGHHPSVKYDMEKLKQLDCSDQILLCEDFLSLTELGDYSALLYAVNLKKLNLSGRILNDFTCLRNCSKLKELNAAMTNLEDLSILSCLPELLRLDLRGCLKLRHLEGLLSLKELRYLAVSIKDYPAVSECFAADEYFSSRPVNEITSPTDAIFQWETKKG